MSKILSVITTVYNCEKYVTESLRSILDQTFRDFELILINDGSTDHTGAICKKFADRDSRIRYFHHHDNKKIPTRRNEAIRLAQGDLIAIHDGDDISLPDRLADQTGFLRNHLDYFCVGGHATKINAEGTPFGEMNYPPALHDEIVEMLVRRNINPMIDPTTMFRRSGFIELGSYTLDKDIYTVPDLDLWTKAILSGRKFANLQYPVIQYRMNPKGMTGLHKQEMIRAHMQVWQKFMIKYMEQQRSSNGK